MMIVRQIKDWQFRCQVVNGLYQMAMGKARTVKAYTDWGVPDTMTGRMNMISLFVVILMFHLNRCAKQDTIGSKQAQKMIQKLYNLMEQDLDAALRRMGVGDDGVLHRMRKASSSFYGDYFALTPILGQAEGFDLFQDAVKRNIYAAYLEQDAHERLDLEKVRLFSNWVWEYHQSLCTESYQTLCHQALRCVRTVYKP